MLSYDYYLFDFDGTLFDSSCGIYESMKQVCNYYKLSYTEDTFRKME